MTMRRMEQEIKELQAGLGAVVKALNFLQTFLESDYGLKFQFDAYCNSPLHSRNSGLLEMLKQKYPESLLHNTFYNENERLYQPQHDSSSDAGSSSLIHLPFSHSQEGMEGLEQTVISTASTSSSCTNTLNPNFINIDTNCHPDPSTPHSRNHSSPILVNNDDLFVISDLAVATLKGEPHGGYDHNEEEAEAFATPTIEDENDSNDEIEMAQIQANQSGKNSENKRTTTVQNKRTKKEKITEGFKCPHCRRRCTDRIKLELHMSHHKQQFQCTDCGLWLADKSVLKRHLRTHTGARPFKCTFCQESFSRQDTVKKHIQRKHKDMIETV